ncbi:hypothetical protein [Bifidobacterium aerophilum]|uniref:hypothetical protein n=1 Tax=Bifidobacterium aerophilum TaxID=1798155 RepID=UPI0013D5D0D1|nr:hypothetical protein [Bifidobacterium aerophilum]
MLEFADASGPYARRHRLGFGQRVAQPAHEPFRDMLEQHVARAVHLRVRIAGIRDGGAHDVVRRVTHPPVHAIPVHAGITQVTGVGRDDHARQHPAAAAEQHLFARPYGITCNIQCKCRPKSTVDRCGASTENQVEAARGAEYNTGECGNGAELFTHVPVSSFMSISLVVRLNNHPKMSEAG